MVHEADGLAVTNEHGIADTIEVSVTLPGGEQRVPEVTLGGAAETPRTG